MAQRFDGATEFKYFLLAEWKQMREREIILYFLVLEANEMVIAGRPLSTKTVATFEKKELAEVSVLTVITKT